MRIDPVLGALVVFASLAIPGAVVANAYNPDRYDETRRNETKSVVVKELSAQGVCLAGVADLTFRQYNFTAVGVYICGNGHALAWLNPSTNKWELACSDVDDVIVPVSNPRMNRQFNQNHTCPIGVHADDYQ